MRQTTSSTPIRRSAKGLAPAATERRSNDERRTRSRLRELCDEVLASYRAARGDEPLSAEDRAAADRLLAKVAPPTR